MRFRAFARFLGCLAAISILSGVAKGGPLLITGVMDGTLTGGRPKVVELAACEDIADLSQYALGIASNGAAAFTPIDSNYILPAISLSAGEFFYGVGNSFEDQTAVFDSVFPGKMRARNFAANSNGDDVIGLFHDPTGLFAGAEVLVDVMGELGVDGTGTAWDHLDGWIYSNNLRQPSPTFDVNDWYVSGVDAMDGFNEAEIAASFPDGTFQCIPEPASVALMILAAAALAGSRRRAER